MHTGMGAVMGMGVPTLWSRGNDVECTLFQNIIPCKKLVTFPQRGEYVTPPICKVESI